MTDNKDCADSKGKLYPWQKVTGSTETCLSIIEQRREDILEQLPDENSEEDLQIGEFSSLIEEWPVLLMERDRLIRKRIEEDNKETLDRCFTKLYHVLTTIGHLDHSQTPIPLKQALCSLYRELKTYRKDLEEGMLNETIPPPSTPVSTSFDISSIHNSAKKVKFDEDYEDYTGTPVSTKNLAVEIVPMNSTPKRKTPKCTPRSFLRTPKGVSSNVQRTPKSSTTRRNLTLLHHQDENLRKLLLSGREKLKSTPGVKRSPGGTPLRDERLLNLDNPVDMVSLALHKKFRNVRRLYGSPREPDSEDFDSSLQISID